MPSLWLNTARGHKDKLAHDPHLVDLDVSLLTGRHLVIETSVLDIEHKKPGKNYERAMNNETFSWQVKYEI